MTQSPPERLSEFAGSVLRQETRGSGGDLPVGFLRVWRALHQRLAPLISSAGYQTLFDRALKLASRDFPLLATVTVADDGRTLSGVPATTDPQSSIVEEAFTAALAHFIWLLIIFIGEHLALRKVIEAWPEVPLDGVNPSSGALK